MKNRTIRATPSPIAAQTFLPRGPRLWLAGAVTASAVAGMLALACAPPTERPASSDQHIEAQGNLVISQIYPGSTGPAHADDAFIELFNRGVGPVALRGQTVQVATATGAFSAQNAIRLDTDAVLEPGAHFLISLDPPSATVDAGTDASASEVPEAGAPPLLQDAATPREGVRLVIGSTGKIALTNVALDGCGGATDSTPCTGWLDLVSFGEASQFEGTAAMPPLADGKAAYRKRGGCQDTNDNAEDFLLEPPIPHGIGSPRAVCGQDGTNGSNGSQGPQGDKGDTGAMGDKGDKGDTGAAGAKGDTGATGAKGDKGDTGATGANGDKGPAAPPGAAGADGKDGARGAAGAAGSQGAQGVPGNNGTDGGCSAAPNGTPSSPAGAVVGVALTLAALRRRRKAS